MFEVSSDVRLFRYAAPCLLEGNSNMTKPAIDVVPRPRPSTRERGSGNFIGILCVSNHVTHAYAHAHFSNKRVIREQRIVSCPGGGVWVASHVSLNVTIA